MNFNPWVAAVVITIAACAAMAQHDEDDTEQDEQNEYERAPLTFKGYECTDDCSGHEAGYEWAERKRITDPEDCRGKSRSFIEGCRAYARGE